MSRPLLAPSSSSTELLRNQGAQPSPPPSNTSSHGRQQSLSSIMQPVRPTSPVPVTSRPSQARKRRGLPRIFRVWWLEIGCAIIAIGAVVAIFATLYPYSGNVLPQWPYNLSINALISIYVVMLKAAVLLIVTQGFGQLKWIWFKETRPLKDVEIYDEASRGSVRGALSLIWRLRGCQVIPCIGAFVIVITIFSDPIAQQLVHYNQCQRAVPRSSSSVPRTNVYNNQGGEVFRNGNGMTTVPSEMLAAINAGVFSPDAVSIPFDCPSGNCTAPGTFRTVGYCSRCDDVTKELNVTQSKGEVPRVSLPSGLTAAADDANFAMSYGPIKPVAGVEIIDLMGSVLQPHCQPDNTSWSCIPQAAARCWLYACVKTFNATISGGKLHEQQISKDEDWPQKGGFSLPTPADYANTIDMECINDSQRQSLRHHGYQFDDATTKFLPYNTSYDPTWPDGQPWSSRWSPGDPAPQPTNATMQIIPPQCIYSQSGTADRSLAGFFTDFFTGNMTSAPGVAYPTSAVVEQFFQGGNATFQSVSETMRNISRAMTTVMRTNGVKGRSEPVTGQVFRTDTCVDVQWGWFAFPASLVSLALTFFVGMLVKTRSRSGDETSSHDYKSSALALMFHGLEERTVEKGVGGGVGVGKVGRVEGLRKEAEGIYVKLQVRTGGNGTGTGTGSGSSWGFVETAGPRPRRVKA